MNKALFCLDITEDKKNHIEDGRELIIRKIDPLLLSELKELQEEEQRLQKSAYSMPLVITQIVLQGLFIMLLAITAISTINIGFETAYGNAAIVFYLIPLLGVLAIGLRIYNKRKMKKVSESEEVNEFAKRVDELGKITQQQLDIPDDIIPMDFYLYEYKRKENDIKIADPVFVNQQLGVFVEDGTLCIATLDQVYGIQIDLISINKIDKKVIGFKWNKEESIKSEEYKEYKLKKTDQGITAKSYYELSFDSMGNHYVLSVPIYEIKKIVELTELELS